MNHNQHLYFVILAGGNGERLWPLSRQATPKQLLKVGIDTTLLHQAIERIAPLVYSNDSIWVSTTQEHETSIRAAVGDKVGRYIVEPAMRNTGPAMIYCCDQLRAYDPKAQVVFLPADSFIPATDYDQFRLCLQRAIDFSVAHLALVLCGITPTYAATGYGYIEYARSIHISEHLFKVSRFHEKPTVAVAQYYLQMSNMLWNSGIIVCSVNLFMRLCVQQAPDLVGAVERYTMGIDSYAAVPAISIDYALLEHADNVWIMPMNIAWFDVGNLGVLLALQQSQQRSDTILSIDASDNLVYTQGKLVVFIGIEQVCVVDMPDVLLITKKESAESVKRAVNALKQQGLDQYL